MEQSVSEIEYKKAQRDCFCRGCDKVIKRDTEKVIKFYSSRNRGMNIIICDKCVHEINNLLLENIIDDFDENEEIADVCFGVARDDSGEEFFYNKGLLPAENPPPMPSVKQPKDEE